MSRVPPQFVSIKACMIGQASAQCAETEEAWEDGKIVRKNYLYPLTSEGALLIETQWYTEQDDDLYAAWLWKIVSSITV